MVKVEDRTERFERSHLYDGERSKLVSILFPRDELFEIDGALTIGRSIIYFPGFEIIGVAGEKNFQKALTIATAFERRGYDKEITLITDYSGGEEVN